MNKTYYSLDIKNPYLNKGNFLWKHNSDKDLGKEKEWNDNYKELATSENWYDRHIAQKAYLRHKRRKK